jgi:dTDP-4-amino-4,6-dideoxygalactose transaminase
MPVATKQVPVARPYFGQEEEQAVAEVLRSGWVTTGPRVAELERRFAEYVDAAYAVAVSSCTTGLHMAMVASGIGAGHQVLCPSFSFIATANCIRYAGARPIFVDIDRSSYNIDPNRIEEAITPQTRAILVAHQIGLPAAMDEILEIAGRHGLVVIEDAAPAAGAVYKNRRIGAPHGSIAVFSFDARKVMCTGEGGIITTANEEFASRIGRLRAHAMSMSGALRHSAKKVMIESYDEVGFNYKMTDIQAAVGIVQLKRLPDFIRQRRALADRYSRKLSAFDWIVVPSEPDGCSHNYQSYMIRLQVDSPMTRDVLMQKLLERGIATRRGVMPIHREKPYWAADWEKLLPETAAAADHTIMLPLYVQMTDEEQDYVIESIAEIAASA